MRSKRQFQTYTGRWIDVTNPKESDVHLDDIIWALSKVQRFGGHAATEFYSVAEHSVLVSRLCDPEHAILGLFHDASEAYIGDVITPLKRKLSDYKAIEDRWQRAIGRAVGIGDALVKLPRDVKIADAVALQTERRDLFPRSRAWESGPRPSEEQRVLGLSPHASGACFRSRLRVILGVSDYMKLMF